MKRAAIILALAAVFAFFWVRWLATLGEPQSVWIVSLFQ